jgi:hypothetical protein
MFKTKRKNRGIPKFDILVYHSKSVSDTKKARTRYRTTAKHVIKLLIQTWYYHKNITVPKQGIDIDTSTLPVFEGK